MPPSPPASASRATWLSPLLVDFATLWLAGFVVRSALFLIVTGSPFPESPLRWYEETGLVSLRLIATIPSTLFIAFCFTSIRAASRLPWHIGRPISVLCWAGPCTLVLISLSSWAAFYTTGQFLGSEAWALALSSPSLLLDHVIEIAPAALIVVPVATLMMILAYQRLCDWTFAWSPARSRILVNSVGAVLALAVVDAFVGDIAAAHDDTPVTSGPGGSKAMPQEVYASAAMDKSGPIARLLVDAFHSMRTTTLRAERWARSGERGRKILPAAEYAKRATAASGPRYSVVVVLIESLRHDELAAGGSKRVVMPSLEALAREATVYTDVIAPAAQSDYSTTSILSSQFPLRSTTFHPFPEHPAYPRVLGFDVFKALGYRTAVFSSQNEHWAGMYNYLQDGSIEHFLHAETFKGPTYAANSDRGFREWMEKAGHAGKIDDSDTIDEAIAWTDSIHRAPFFAYVNLQSSHNPYLLARTFTPRFGSGHVSFPILFDVYPKDSVQAVRDLYDNSLAYADAQLARLFAALTREGRWNSTIVVVLGDHGAAFYEHGFGAHGSELFGEVTHVPLIIRVPSQRAARDALPASSIDVLPTVLGILKLPPHPAFQGIDLANRAERKDRPRFTLTQSAMADEVGVDQDQWKLMYDLRHSTARLFDLRNDPGETRDVSAQFPDQRDALMGTMAAWWSRQVDYYKNVPAAPEYYAPGAPTAVPLERPHAAAAP